MDTQGSTTTIGSDSEPLSETAPTTGDPVALAGQTEADESSLVKDVIILPSPSPGIALEMPETVGSTVKVASDTDSGRTSSLIAAGPLVFGLATVVTLVVYLLPVSAIAADENGFWQDWGNYLAVGAGVLAGCVIAAAIGFGRFLKHANHTAPDRVNPRQFGELCARWSSLDAVYLNVCPPASLDGNGAAPTATQLTACREAAIHRAFIAAELGLPVDEHPANAAGEARKSTGAKWVLGSGFIDLWARLHRAEAALVTVQPKADVIAGAFNDEARLVGSNIENSDDMLRKLRAAVVTLGGKEYLSTDAVALLGNVQENTDPEAQTRARLVLRDVREAISKFRDGRRAGLAQTHNQLMWTGVITGVFTYAMLALAILVGVNRETVTAAAAFFLTGAVIGLFAQLRSWSSGETGDGSDDFGLTKARLLYAPLLSGLAAVGGVVVTTMLYATVNGAILRDPAGSETASPPLETPRLERIFDLQEDRFGLVLAAVFGLTPELLINRLQGQADKYRVDLQSTNVQTRSA